IRDGHVTGVQTCALPIYKQQGRAKPYRLNGCPTVEAYFESLSLNYSTVRSWKSRAQQRLLQAAADAGTKPEPKDPITDPVPQWKIGRASCRERVQNTVYG